jgi:hypothetical protein
VPTAVVTAKPNPATSVTLDVSRSIVIYGGAVSLSGSVSNAQAGQTVTIMEHRFPFGRAAQVRELATVKTDADGSFSITAHPLIRTLYTAKAGTTRSDAVPVNVRPLIRLSHTGLHRFRARAFAARPFVGKYAVLQRWNRRTHVWVGVRRVYFRSIVGGVTPTRVSQATFRANFVGRAKIRVFMPLRQTVPGYISGSSNARIA